jgi:ribA/ribD-fused uncharacterized protein
MEPADADSLEQLQPNLNRTTYRVIHFYRTEDAYGAFSNFSRHPITVDGIEWPTTEHYFQAQKFMGTPHMESIRRMSSPGDAARAGRSRSRPLRADWESVKETVMLTALRAKFTQHADLRAMLLDTENALLVENTTDDYYWGIGTNRSGLNRLGELLMDLRAELSGTPRPTPPPAVQKSERKAVVEAEVPAAKNNARPPRRRRGGNPYVDADGSSKLEKTPDGRAAVVGSDLSVNMRALTGAAQHAVFMNQFRRRQHDEDAELSDDSDSACQDQPTYLPSSNMLGNYLGFRPVRRTPPKTPPNLASSAEANPPDVRIEALACMHDTTEIMQKLRSCPNTESARPLFASLALRKTELSRLVQQVGGSSAEDEALVEQLLEAIDAANGAAMLVGTQQQL